jgi:hypothetical protein
MPLDDADQQLSVSIDRLFGRGHLTVSYAASPLCGTAVFVSLCLKINPNIWMAMRGVIAIIAMTPKASVMGLPPAVDEAPNVNDRMKVEDIGPEATPPESKAMAVKRGGLQKVSAKANV